jgi:hypothetical protein
MQRKTLEKMTQFAVNVSPVDTSAYVDSFGFNDPQGFTSRGRPRGQDVNAAKARNKARLLSEVASLNLEGPVVFGNNAPHAGIVESGTVKQSGFQVFAQVRNQFTNMARAALQEARQQ